MGGAGGGGVGVGTHRHLGGVAESSLEDAPDTPHAGHAGHEAQPEVGHATAPATGVGGSEGVHVMVSPRAYLAATTAAAGTRQAARGRWHRPQRAASADA